MRILPVRRTTVPMHIAEIALELLSLGRLPEPDLGDAEGHLLVCESCRARLQAMDVFTASLRAALRQTSASVVWWQLHATAEGPVQIWVEKTTNGRYLSRRVGAHVDGGAKLTNEKDAVIEAMQSFWEMFPEHCCSEDCILQK